ncbi:MAG TPA: hypothetical protein DCP90_03360 [Clostridiales bacterium]|nr:MAG: hypothetical protein A2Y22_03035 [Clostridiales bacterium GWD2_32_59]HAN09634.1 hypothetical protein [Clostridiales bacterium]
MPKLTPKSKVGKCGLVAKNDCIIAEQKLVLEPEIAKYDPMIRYNLKAYFSENMYNGLSEEQIDSLIMSEILNIPKKKIQEELGLKDNKALNKSISCAKRILGGDIKNAREMLSAFKNEYNYIWSKTEIQSAEKSEKEPKLESQGDFSESDKSVLQKVNETVELIFGSSSKYENSGYKNYDQERKYPDTN